MSSSSSKAAAKPAAAAPGTATGIVKMEVPKDGAHPKYNDAFFKQNAYCGGFQATELDKALFEAYVSHGTPPQGEHFQRWFQHVAKLIEKGGM